MSGNVYSGDYAVTVQRSLDGTPYTAQISVGTAGTAVQGPDMALTNGCYVFAHPSNTGLTYVGNTSNGITSANGAVLAAAGVGPGIPFAVTNVNQLWFNAAVNGEKLFVVKA